MTDHAKTPRLCRTCAERAHELAAKSGGTAHVFCDEHRVLATMEVRAGRIVGWFVAGPLTDQQREVMLAEVKLRARSMTAARCPSLRPGIDYFPRL